MAYEESFAALSDPTRKAVFDRLRHGPLTVGALAAGLPVSRPAISQHLKVLKEAGLVTGQADGARRLYRLDRRGLAILKDYLLEVWQYAEKAHQDEVARQLEERRYG
jgi:DNA-binding transcriptional ArsR family regulator